MRAFGNSFLTILMRDPYEQNEQSHSNNKNFGSSFKINFYVMKMKKGNKTLLII